MSMKLLILDDEVMSVEIMLKKVDWKSCGIDEVLVAYHAEGAREILEREQVDIILCDIEMPGESGIEFMQWARANSYEMACIFLTCHARFEYAQEAVRLNSKDYILLPAPYDVIQEKVKAVVGELSRQREQERAASIGTRWVDEKQEEMKKLYGRNRSRIQVIEEVKGHVAKHLSDPGLSVQSIAKDMGLNSDYLGTLFRQETGTTINKYLVETRMELAAAMIREGQLSIAAIAEAVGYENPSYFSTSFKKIYGFTPAKYGKEE